MADKGKEMVKCPSCDAEFPASCTFCPNCGVKVDEQPARSDDEGLGKLIDERIAKAFEAREKKPPAKARAGKFFDW